jgi:FtsP/CotA-like multicopper oxidase with cupredoxin domain
MGLYGNYLVDSPENGYWNPVNREIPLVIDDILIENDRIAGFYKEFTNYALLGRFGNEFLVNGQPDFELQVRKGEVIRFFLTNVSNARTYNLSLPDVQTKIVGADLGKYEHEMFSDTLLISPAERMVMEAYFKNPGTYQLTHTQPDGEIALARIHVSETDTVDTSYARSFSVSRHN